MKGPPTSRDSFEVAIDVAERSGRAGDRFQPRTIGKVVSATALIDYAFSEADTLEGKAAWERIRGEWQALKRERIGNEAIAEWSVAIMAEQLKVVVPAAPGSRAASHH